MPVRLTNSRLVAYMVWIIASIFYAYQYLLRVMPNIMINDIMQQFDIGAATFGQFSGVYYLGYSLLHLPVGIMLDRYGPRKVMSGCILLTILGLSPLLFAENWMFPIIGRFLIGIGSSAAILGVFKIVRMTFTEKQFPRMLSFSVTIGLIGGIYGGGPVAYMHEIFGYQTVVQLYAVLGLILAIATYVIIPEIKSEEQTTVFSDIKEVISNRKVVWSCVFAGMMVGPMEGFADVWGTVFFKQVYGLEGSIAASLPSMILIGMCFGAPLLSFIADKVGNPLITIIGSGTIMSLSFALLVFFHLTPAILSLSFLLVGVCCGYQILAIYKASTYVREHVVGLTTAVANMIIMVFGYVFHTAMGSVINAYGGAEVVQALEYGILVVPIGLLIGTLGFSFLFIEEKKTILRDCK